MLNLVVLLYSSGGAHSINADQAVFHFNLIVAKCKVLHCVLIISSVRVFILKLKHMLLIDTYQYVPPQYYEDMYILNTITKSNKKLLHV